MTRETTPPPEANQQPATERPRSESIGLAASKKQLYAGAAALLLALATAIPALVNSCQAQSAANVGVKRADQADETATATYDVARKRFEKHVKQLAKQADEIAALDALVAMLVKRCLTPAEQRAIRALSPPDAELPPNLTEPLPATPEQAAAEAASKKE